MTKARRRRVLIGAAVLGLATVVAVQLYPSGRGHEAQASLQLLTADHSPQTTIHLTTAEIARRETLSDLTDRAAAQSPFEVVITAEANTEGRARALVDSATQRAHAALASGARATPEIVAKAQQRVAAAQDALSAAQGALSTADAALAAWRDDKGAEDPSAQLAQKDRQLVDLRGQRDAADAAGQDTRSLEAQIAQAQQDRFEIESAEKQFADLQDRRTAAAADLARARDAVDSARVRLARYQAGSTGSIAVAPIHTESVVADRGFGPGVTAVSLLALVATLGVLALATRSRPGVALDLTQPAPAREAGPEPRPEAETRPQPEAAAPDAEGPPRAARPFTTVKLRSPGKP